MSHGSAVFHAYVGKLSIDLYNPYFKITLQNTWYRILTKDRKIFLIQILLGIFLRLISFIEALQTRKLLVTQRFGFNIGTNYILHLFDASTKMSALLLINLRVY